MKISMTFIIAAAIFVGGSAFVQQDVGESVQRGKEVYTTFCQNCHLESGEGIPGVNPPLAKADYLKKANRNFNSCYFGRAGRTDHGEWGKVCH